MPSPKKIFDEKLKLVAQLTEDLDMNLGSLSKELFRMLVDEFLDQLDRDGDEIKQTPKNLQLINAIDKLYSAFMQGSGASIPESIINGIEKISKYNVDYFASLTDAKARYQSSVKKIKTIISNRLGVSGDGKGVQLKPGGFMDSMLKDNKVRNDIKKLSYREVVKGSGFKSLKEGLRNFIQGDQEKLGAFRQYYRNYSYDIFVQTDRDESMLLATELELKCFFYEGSIIETSRKFCIKRAGKLFTVEEAQQWEDDPWIQNMIERGYITSYNPLSDMGGIACRHAPRFVSNEVAIAMRPELKNVLS